MNRPMVFDKVTDDGKKFVTCDFVACCNCDTVMLVDRGSDVCPVCEEQTLCWEDEDNFEIEYDIAERKLNEFGYLLCDEVIV